MVSLERKMGFLTCLWRNSSGRLRKSSIGPKKVKLVIEKGFPIRLRLFMKEMMAAMNASNMLHPSLRPPECVKGMTSLSRDSFNKTVKVPGIKLPKKQISFTQKSWKPLLLKLRGIKPIASLDNNDPLKDTHNLILLDPAKLDDSNEMTGMLEKLQKLGYSTESVENFELEIGYENWSVSEIMKAVLPHDADNVSSFTQIGHIAHLNLKEENLPFKHLIGEVIIDKISSVETVVNKLNSIDNTYRNFEMELLAGANNFVTQTREHNCVFEMDFSKVYWNSRLSTEHQRIVDIIPKESVVYDVFAGVGPFTVPLAKKRNCTVFANDLNPHSFNSLERNIELNKLKTGSVKAFNMDGRNFIKNILKPDLTERIKGAHLKYSEQKRISLSDEVEFEDPKNIRCLGDEMCFSTFVVMNLPALAVDFLDSFVSLLCDIPVECQNPYIVDQVLPIVYCYAFIGKTDDMDGAVKKRAENVLNQKLPSNATVRVVRNVSPNKEMVCLSFKLWSGLVFAVNETGNPEGDEYDEPLCKVSKHS